MIRLKSQTCSHDYRGRFCSRCGVEINPPRLTIHALLAELSASWLQRGFRQTFIGLLLSPGRQIARYLKTDRNLLIKPVSYLIVISAFHLFVLSQFSATGDQLDQVALGLEPASRQNLLLVASLRWLLDHFYQFALAQAALIAVLLRFVFYRSKQYTLAEYIIFMTYVTAQSVLLQAIGTLGFLPTHHPMPALVHLAIAFLYTSWAISQFMEAETTADYLKAAVGYFTALALSLTFIVSIVVLLEENNPIAVKAVETIVAPELHAP